MTVTSSPGASSSATPGAGTPAVTSATAADKIPKTLPAGVWSQQVNKFNAEKLRGRDRSFPEEMLLGAEVVLARMWHEHHVTKMYTPTSLGEILAKRSFTATGEVNMLAKNPKKSNVLTIEDEQLVQEDEKVWSPRSVLSIMDGIEAVVWAWILLEIGEEHHCQAFGKWCISKARSRSQKLEQFKQWWDAANWKIAMRMRAGATFGEVSAEVMADVDLFNDHMSRDPPKDTPAVRKEPVKKRPAQASYDDEPAKRSKGSQSKGGKGSSGRRRDRGWNQQPSYWRDNRGWDDSWSRSKAHDGHERSDASGSR